MADAPVYVGVLLVTLETPTARSLKEKRSLVLPIVERLKARYPLSVARLEGLDDHGWERIGAVAISADRAWLERTLASALAFVEGRGVGLHGASLDIDVWEPG